MIKDLELYDFISHKETLLKFGKGITVFVGHNGAGKSSVIDAVTFALIGKHTRNHNKNLVRRGSGTGQAMVKMCFTLNSREFQATRSLSATGTASFSQLELVSEHGKEVRKKLAGGERKQYGESMSAEVAKVLGLDYDKLRVAAVVQQGELVKIVESQPKEFKILLNGLIGIDRLDAAYEAMKEVIDGFRGRLRDETGGYTDQDLPRVRTQMAENEKKMLEDRRLAGEYAEEKARLDARMADLDKVIAAIEPLRDKDGELKLKEKRLVRHVEDRREQAAGEIRRLEKVIGEARNALALMEGKEEICMRLEMVKAELEDVQKRLEANEKAAGKLQGLTECAGRLQLVDGRCPVCNSAVRKVNEMFDGAHIRAESARLAKEKSGLQMERVSLKKDEQKLVDEGKRVAAAEAFLASNSVKSARDIDNLQADLAPKKTVMDRLPAQVVKVDDPMMLAIDDASKLYAEEILAMRLQLKGFSEARYKEAKDDRWKVLQKLQEAATRLGAYKKAADDLKALIESDGKAAALLEQASEIVCLMEQIRSRVYNRDGPVGTSLRSYALGMISKKASDYASLFNIGISRIELAEKAREIAITCYGKNGEINLDSLSGGEKVAVALALRLGIAHMMGSGKLDFVILDEPTTHLDEERRKALVKIISEAFKDGSGPLSQMLIITHDSDIFEDSEVDAVYRFAMTAEGSHVTRE
jgi:exonuclease SbcC